MNILLYVIIFVIGMIFGGLTTLINRIKLSKRIATLKPYILSTIISGTIFVLFALSMDLTIVTLTKDMLMYFIFATLYISILFIVAGIDKEKSEIDKTALLLGFTISTLYMVYTYITNNDISVYRYAIYLLFVCILIIADTIYMKSKAKQNYTLNVLLLSMVMILFTYEGVYFLTITYTLLIIGIKLLLNKIINRKIKYVKSDEKVKVKIPVAYYMCLANIVMLLITNYYVFYMNV